MAIEDSNNTNQQAAPEVNQQTTGQQQFGYGSAAPQQPRTQTGLASLNQLLQRSGAYDGSETRSSEALKAFTEAREHAVGSQALADDFELVRFDRDTNRVGLSSILVTKMVKAKGSIYSVVRTLILDSDAVRLRPRTLQMGVERVDIATRPQDVFNDTYWSRMSQFIVRAKGVPEMVVADAGPLVIPTDFDFKDAQAVTRLLITSVNRCDDIVAKILGETPFTVQAVKGQDEFLTARLDFSGLPQTDIVGHPIRSDITVTMNRSSKNAQNQDDFYESETSFNAVSGFVNLEYTPPQAAVQQMGWSQPQMPTQLFTPTFVITDVRQAEWIRANTLELYILAISNAYRVTAGTSWARTFLPSVGTKKDPKDIGALGYLTAAGQKIKTKGDTFSDQDFAELMGALVKPNPTFLLDVNPVGENAALENLFVDAAGGANQARAVEAIIRACNNLTGNAFSKYFDASKHALVVPYASDVHLGYYEDEHNEKRDIRDLDVLAALNASEGNVQEFMNWYRTWCDLSTHSEIRLKQREGFERAYLAQNMVITGRATRLLLTGEFIEALDKATKEAGVNVSMENVSTTFGAQRFIGNQLVGQYSVSSNAQVSMGAVGGGQVYNVGGVTNSGRIY
jgi:hypothetical protein